MDVGDWLRNQGLGQYAAAFRDNEIDAGVLPGLTAEDLRDLGVTLVGHRRRLLDAIAALGQEAVSAPSAAPIPAAAADAERRQLTVLFCDLAGSTELAARLDPEDLRAIISAYHQAVAAVLTGFGGFVAKYMGDGILAYFGYPQAHEEDCERAVRAGLAIVDAVARLGLSEPLRVRIGIATGLVVVGDLIGAGAAQEQAVVGETPNLAARLQALAQPNEIVIADGTRRQLGGLFEIRDLGAQALKGFAAAQRVWGVVGESGVASRFEALRSGETPLVGRDEEIDLLLRRWAQAKAGEGRVVLISAEPGIGKSRLAEAVEERIAAEPHTRPRYFCSPHHQDSALYPIIGQIERAAGFARDDTAPIKQEKLAALFRGSPPDELLLVAELLSLPATQPRSDLELTPQRRKEMTFEALLGSLERLSRHQPVLMLFEDLHWMDPTSRELLDRTIARVEHLPVLLVATFRPEFVPPWTGLPHVTMLALNRLGRRDGALLVARLVGNAGLPADLIDEIVERTDGVPLFLEEVTKVVMETAGGSDAAARGMLAAIPGARLAVPPTLQASLMARLDRLGSAAKETAQIGAAIGREFSYELLSAVAPRGGAETEAALARLVAAGLVFQRGTPPSAEYQFKHALVQDTAYGTLLRGPRQSLHGRIAAAISERSPDIADRQPELLAYHFAEAGQPERAASYWLDAGRRAASRSANIEAVAHLRRGIEALAPIAETPERIRSELALQLALGPAVMSIRGFGAPDAETAYRRARELAERSGDARLLFAALWGLWLTTGQSAPGGHEETLVEELFRVAAPLDDPGLRMQAHHAGWATLIFRGDLAGSSEHVRQGLKLYDRKQHGTHALLYGGHDPAVCGTGQGAMALWMLGYPDQAVESARQGIDLANAVAHLPSIGHSLWFAGTVHMMRRDAPAALDTGQRLVALGREHGLAAYEAVGGIIRGWARAGLGEAEEGVAELRQAINVYRANATVMLGLFITALAETELRGGYIDRAGAALNDASAEIERKEVIWSSDFLRIKGDLVAAQSPVDFSAAEHSYNLARAFARERDAKSLELRAALALARLWCQQGRRDEAHDLLAPLYGWFTEGLDTPDLVEAKTLLDELR
jgi:class 3 adenylate cyclase